MVAVLARLQLTLMARSLRQSTGRTIAVIFGGLFGLLVVAGLVATFVVTADNATTDVRTTTVLLLGGVVTAWIVMPLLVFGVDPTLDPARFALLPLSARRLRPGLLVAGLIGVPGVLTALIALGSVLAWTGQSAATVILALAMAPVLLLTCFLAARALTSWFAAALSSRRFQDFAALVLGVFVVTVGLGSQMIGNGVTNDPDRAGQLMERAAVALGWTPLGWAAAVPADIAEQRWGTGALRLLLAVGLVVVLWFAWGAALQRALTSISDAGSTSTGSTGGWADRLYPARPAGAVAARCLRYWRRDPRYSVSLVSVVVVPLMIGAMGSLGSGPTGGSSLGAFAMPLIVAALAGPMMVADLAYDHSALWTHIALGVSGAADRLGRSLAMATVITPVLVVTYVAALIMSGRADLWLGLLAALPPVLLCGLGVGSFIGGLFPGQAPPPGANPFGTGGSGSGILTMVMFIGGGAATVVVAAPIVVPLLLWGSSTAIAASLLVVGLGWGLLAFRTGVALGGRRLDATWPEMLTKVAVEKG